MAVREHGGGGLRVQQSADVQPDGAGGHPSLLVPAGTGQPGHVHLGTDQWHCPALSLEGIIGSDRVVERLP